jgi:hypothetical protein
MTTAILTLGCLLASTTLVAATKQQPTFEIRQPTIIAFFAPVTKADLKDGDTNEALSDFQYYAGKLEQPLKAAGIDFKEAYTRSFRVHLGNRLSTFRPGKRDVGYYFIAPGKEPHIEYGVLTADDILLAAKEYFGDGVKLSEPPGDE